jgi:ABC-type long-subunit fatty acid transport system fused permease/ATPase subunit
MDPLFIAIYRHFSQAQTASNKTALTVMTTIEQQFNVKFSYAVEDVVHQHRKPATDLTLQETIYLNSKVLLNFKALDTRYVTVSVLNKTFRVRYCVDSGFSGNTTRSNCKR